MSIMKLVDVTQKLHDGSDSRLRTMHFAQPHAFHAIGLSFEAFRASKQVRHVRPAGAKVLPLPQPHQPNLGHSMVG